MTQLFIFGDSIVYGAWDLEGGWAQRLRKHLDKRVLDSGIEEYFITYNLGIDGNTSEDLLKRFEQEIKARIDPQEETVIIISTGGNDALYNDKTNSFKTEVNTYKENISQVLQLAKRYSKKIMFIGETPIDESKLSPLPWQPGYSLKNKDRRLFTNTAKEACQENNVEFLDIEPELPSNFENLLVDGAHPNSDGHKMIFEIVLKKLEELKFI